MSLIEADFCPISFPDYVDKLNELNLEAQTSEIEHALRSVSGKSEAEQKKIVEPMAKIVLSQVLELYAATPKLKKEFPSSEYNLTLFEHYDIYDLIRMYKTAGKTFESKEQHKNTLQNAISTNLIKTSLPEKLERIDWDFGRLKDLIRFTIEKKDFGTIENLADDSIKLTDVLAELGYEVMEVDAKYDEGTKYSELTIQYINRNQPTALNPNGTIIEVKFQSKIGMLAKKKEDPIYHERRRVAEQIRQKTRTDLEFSDFIEMLNVHFGRLIDKKENIGDEQHNIILIKTEKNSDFKTLQPLLQEYVVLLRQSKDILKNVPAVVNSKQAAKAFETIFAFKNSPEGREFEKQRKLDIENNNVAIQLVQLRDKINSRRI
jgi:hypothetical protein